jgi:uncharacterized membrane protein YvbJ
VKYCPNGGTGVEPGTASCASCGTDLTAVQTAVAPSVTQPLGVESGAAALTVAELTPRQLRKEIRWGVFQGIALVAGIIFLVYLAIFLVIIAVSGSVTGISG